MITMSTSSGSLYSVYDTDSQNYKFGRMPYVGQRQVDSLGREFVFVSTAVDVAAGLVVAAPAAAAESVNLMSAAAAGATEVVITLAGITANLYANGRLCIVTGTTLTYYTIISNTASDAVTAAATLKLADPLPVAMLVTDDVILIPNRHNLVILGAATYDGVGVALSASTAATEGKTNYLWVQTKGPGMATVGTGAAVTRGVQIILGASGLVEAATNGVQAAFGYCTSAAVSNSDGVPCMLDFKG